MCEFLAGQEIIVANGDHRPIFWETSPNHYDGYDFKLIQYLAVALQFKLRIVPSVDGQWGVRGLGPNETFSGMIGMVERGVI